jgi:hypothetical protein
MALLDMQAMEAARDGKDDHDRSTLSLLSADCHESLLSVIVCS